MLSKRRVKAFRMSKFGNARMMDAAGCNILMLLIRNDGCHCLGTSFYGFRIFVCFFCYQLVDISQLHLRLRGHIAFALFIHLSVCSFC